MSQTSKLHLVSEPSTQERGKIDRSVENSEHLDTIRDRLKYLRNKQKMTQAKFAMAIGVSRSAVGQWESSDIVPSFSKIEEIAEVLRSTPEWITYRRGTPHVKVSYNSEENSDVLWVDHITYGDKPTSITKVYPWGLPRTYVENTLNAQGAKLIAYTVRNDGVSPLYSTGDTVFVNTADKSPSPSGVFLYWDGMGSALATLSSVPGAAEPMVKITTNHEEPTEIPLKDMTIMGRVMGRFQNN